MILQLLILFYLLPPSEQECTILDKPFTCEDINQILDYHNDLRSKVARGHTKLAEAKNMWALKWDKNLAVVAQDWANKCSLKPNTGRANDVGENIGWMSASEIGPIDIESIIEVWFDEIHKYDPEIRAIQDGTEHFTQLIWGDTKFVGCGATIFQKSGQENIYQVLMVCNYKPTGNFVNKVPYELLDKTIIDEESGEVLRCDRGVLSSKNPGLCAHDVGHSLGEYMPCSRYGYNIQPTTWHWAVPVIWILKLLM